MDYGLLITVTKVNQIRCGEMSKPTLSIDTYREHRLYPRVKRSVADILQRSKVVAPIDVLVGMGLLTPKHIEDWRRGRVPYLERVINCNLPRLSRILRILRFHAHDLNLKPSFTAYMRWGKGRSDGSDSPKPAIPSSKRPTQGTSCGRARGRFTPQEKGNDTGRERTR